jgi:dihydrodipicolinate synthase/N-acetylneuraminate lyase
MAKPNPVQPVRGVYAALATPRRANSTEINTAAFFDYQDAIVRGGVDGLVLFGSTGEFVHFDVSDRMHVVSLLCKRSRVPVLVNVSHSTIDGALALAEGAILAEAAGVLLMPPYFYRYTEAQILAFYGRFAEAVQGRTRLFLYNLPFFTDALSFEVIERSLTSGQYAGIKDSSGDRPLSEQVRNLHSRRPFVWLAGSERLFAGMRSSGAEGIVSGVAGALPELMVAFDRALAAQACEVAARLEQMLFEFLNWLEKFPATVAIKQAAVVRGWKLDETAFRFDEGTQDELRTFRRWVEQWLPRVLAECAEVISVKA